ncbi:MAG: YbhB/YbcL family Raf kinase inhibitor-like protein [Peptoclostridium sp.]|uniref:YbhB/YbcL family Raf kinase inhibitor-like protein n=1 Tax=Peptoclostridium sp. TaxID=1904860 RepID=UPI00139E9088|nr:YbhB/YbcL family Raf kinase inhibitor-like protein [Peptoclostridium sp.]MZQ76352.1 YbhB/YbcL family Raf kinase inhibitor-like protein [Peptoclostridium sp.]
MIIKSKAFEDKGPIPSRYTCDGENISPGLSWSDFPEGTKSFALIAEDPDAPSGTWVHWVLYDIPENVTELHEGVLDDEILPNGARQGLNDFKEIGYGGPCPPKGVHRYFFKLYALDEKPGLKSGLSKKSLLDKIKGHVIAESEIYGTYSRR